MPFKSQALYSFELWLLPRISSMKYFPLMGIFCLILTGTACAGDVVGTWEGFANSSAGSPVFFRLHIDKDRGYLLRSVPYGNANVYVVPFQNSDISVNDGIVRIVATEPPSHNQSHVETVILFSVRQNPSKESQTVSAAIGATFEYLLSPKEGRIPFETYAFELNDVRDKSVIDAIDAAVDQYERKPSTAHQGHSATGADVPQGVR